MRLGGLPKYQPSMHHVTTNLQNDSAWLRLCTIAGLMLKPGHCLGGSCKTAVLESVESLCLAVLYEACEDADDHVAVIWAGVAPRGSVDCMFDARATLQCSEGG